MGHPPLTPQIEEPEGTVLSVVNVMVKSLTATDSLSEVYDI